MFCLCPYLCIKYNVPIVTLVCIEATHRFSTYYFDTQSIPGTGTPVLPHYFQGSVRMCSAAIPFLCQTFLFIGKATISMLLCDILSSMLLAAHMFHLQSILEPMKCSNIENTYSLCIAIPSAVILYHPVNSPVHLIHIIPRSRYGHTGCLYLIYSLLGRSICIKSFPYI